MNKVAHLTKKILDGEKNLEKLLPIILQMANLGNEKFNDVEGIVEKYSAGIPGSTALVKKEIELQLA